MEKSRDISIIDALFPFLDKDKIQAHIAQRLQDGVSPGKEAEDVDKFQQLYRNVLDLKHGILPYMHALVHLKTSTEASCFTLQEQLQKKLCDFALSLMLHWEDAGAEHLNISLVERCDTVCELFVLTLKLCQPTYAISLLNEFLKLSLISLTYLASDAANMERSSSVLETKPEQIIIPISTIVHLLCHLFSEPSSPPNDEDPLHCTFKNRDSEQYQSFVQIKVTLLTVLHRIDEFMVVKILMDLIPKMHDMNCSSTELKEFLSKTWNTVLHCFQFHEEGGFEEIHLSGFLILSCISDHMFSIHDQLSGSNQEQEEYPVWATVHFIKIIQYGLVHINPLQRKRSVYFLKRVLEYLQSRNADIPCAVFGGLFYWRQINSAEIQKTFADIMLVLETLEEKQVHVVKPVFPVIINLIALTNENEIWFLHTSWLVVIFQQLLRHDSKTIRKWAIEQICNVNFEHFPIFKQGYEKFLLLEFLDALNDTSLYSRQPNESLEVCTAIANKIQKHYHTCHHALSATEKQAKFFQHLLYNIQNQSWGTVALLHLSRALASLPPSSIWNQSSINDLREIMINTLRTHEVELRCAIQGFLLEAFMKLADLADLTIYNISTVLVIFKREECFKRGSPLYNHFVKWLQLAITINAEKHPKLTKDTAIEFISESLKSVLEDNAASCSDESNSVIIKESREVLRVIRMLVILMDAKIFETHPNGMIGSIQTSLKPVTDILTTCHCRPYMSLGKIDTCLQVLLTLALEVQQVANSLPDELENFLASCIECMAVTFLPYAVNRLLNKDTAYGSIQLYYDFLEYMAKTFTLHKTLQSCMIKLCQSSMHFLKQGSESSFMQRYVAVRSFSTAFRLVQFLDNKLDGLNVYGLHNFMKLCMKDTTLFYIPKNLTDISFADRIHKTNPNQICSDYISAVWYCIANYIIIAELDTTEANLLLEESLQAQQLGSRESLKWIFNAVEFILSKVTEIEEEKVVQILEFSWKTLFDMKPNVDFWQAMNSFVRMTFQPSLMNNDKMAARLLQYGSKICEKSEFCHGIFLPLVRRVTETWSKHRNQSSILNYSGLLVQALTFGHVHRKDQRLIQDTVKLVVQEKPEYVNHLLDSYHLYESEVRIHTIILLLKLENSSNRSKILSLLVNDLLNYEEAITKTRTRHFANSLIHRVKLRVWQTILVLEPMHSWELNEKLLGTVFSRLVEETLQPSVRYVMEWLALRILYRRQDMTGHLWDAFEWASHKRIGSLASFLAIICNMADVLPNTIYKTDFIQKAIPLILPWCAAQHFNTRIYAQAALNKLWKCCQANNFDQILTKYSPMESFFTSSVNHCGSSKGTQKLLEDNSFGVFHHLNHYTLETIFYELPRLSNVTPEEWIEPALFEKCDASLLSSAQTIIPLYNSDNDLATCEPGSFLLRSTTDNLMDSSIQEHKDVQKKVTPWKQMIPDLEALAMSSESIAMKKHQHTDGLIVVASLIDRPTNLGGLCRTCEVFGVSQYIIGSLRYTEDKQFQSLSVSAERWMLIKEVKAHEVQDYLLEIKKHGYTIVGAEQTANSCKLDKFQFPKKTVLVLGNEKEGIPVEIIQLLDVCIEVPQHGLIRSLNVHVTGAILIWEYTRQHLR